VAKRFLPGEADVFVRGAHNLDLIELRAIGEDAAEHFFDLGFVSAGGEQFDAARRDARGMRDIARAHEERERVGGWFGGDQNNRSGDSNSGSGL
jgi:hypothetical protein